MGAEKMKNLLKGRTKYSKVKAIILIASFAILFLLLLNNIYFIN